MAVIDCLLSYDKAKKYQGEMASLKNIELGKANNEPVKFYKGKCETTNLFSFMDPACQGQKFNAMEKIYRD